MAEELRLKVVAEGIENNEQYHFLKAINCDFYQGYLIHKPMKFDDLMACECTDLPLASN